MKVHLLTSVVICFVFRRPSTFGFSFYLAPIPVWGIFEFDYPFSLSSSSRRPCTGNWSSLPNAYRLIMGSGFVDVEARWVSGVFLGVVAVNVETVMGGNSFALRPGIGVNVEKLGGGVISLPLVMLKKKALVEKENVGLDLSKSDLCPSFVEDLTAKGMGLCVADLHTGNHRKDDFTPLETI
ncbi:hypothetical protein Tco_1094436 [Tanacetum coccineum]|uniref:Uncharacterized protein n=1 Tax=Tanacetum coccineum TaxID=301880 RepID=A0ABQ5IHZ1_9ASTR